MSNFCFASFWLSNLIGLVTALVAKRDQVLAEAIEKAISKGLPIDALSSDKKDYTVRSKSKLYQFFLSHVACCRCRLFASIHLDFIV